jgi:tetratricopeptide (TPR) repeat protein
MLELGGIGLIATALAFRILRMTTGKQAATLDKRKFLLHVGGIALLLGYCLLSPFLRVWIQGRAAEDSLISAQSAKAESLRLEGKEAEATDEASKAVSRGEGRFGAEDPRLLHPLDVLARCLTSQRRFPDAEAIHKRALNIRVKHFGESSEEASVGENNLGTLYADMERYPDAEALYQRVLVRTQRVVGQVPPVLPAGLQNLAVLCEKTGRAEEAKGYAARAKAFKTSR